MADIDLKLHRLAGVDDGPADENASVAHAESIARAQASTVGSRQLSRASPRVPLERGNPGGPVRDLVAWRSQHETRIRAAIAAARLRR